MIWPVEFSEEFVVVTVADVAVFPASRTGI